ncbi:NADPH-dependent FMN reductase [Mangrovibacter sp. MFB070]|uniref:NADPH-dependent FMN reductase n=1 Tax=Mangrovibacter sp. MFB070 TaxID=1224318 RepID=UPI0004DA972B|nr:NADPH-dependent FMN reductase [Mangrovibacter sp. MFB070]KEA53886.1 NADPH-dependent FMN reductase [Mangrovibacter sp. MFB070]
MMKPLNIICLHSGIRRQSHSQAVLACAIECLPANTQVHTLPIGEYPHYNQDVEQEAMPALIHDARSAVSQCDAVIIVTSEYNHGIPGVLKNALDWLSRPVRASAMMGKPVFFISQSTSALGGVRAQYQLRETLSSMLCELVALPEIVITSAAEKIQDGKLQDAKTRSFIAAQLDTFLNAVYRRQGE